MELGNAMFGNSRGAVPIERGVGYEKALERLFEVMDSDSYGKQFENNVFVTNPYYWGDCSCGYEERWYQKDLIWCENNSHSSDCYQTELKSAMDKYDQESGCTELYETAFGKNPSSFSMLFGVNPVIETDGAVTGISSSEPTSAHKKWGKAYDQRRAFQDKLYKRLMAKYNKPEQGCAVHCTCAYEAKRKEWCATDAHSEQCALLQPNFLHKPSGLRIEWYKYPLRDSYFNRECSLTEFKTIINECIASL